MIKIGLVAHFLGQPMAITRLSNKCRCQWPVKLRPILTSDARTMMIYHSTRTLNRFFEASAIDIN